MRTGISLPGRFDVVLFIVLCGAARVAGAAPAAPAPDLSISLRGVWGGVVEAGEPFRVSVRVAPAGEATAKLELAPMQGSWIEATVVQIFSADGKAVSATARSVTKDAERVTNIDTENAAFGLWWFPADSLAAVAPGSYLVRARLAIRDGSGWKGEVDSEPAALKVVAPSNDPERVLQRKLGRAQAAMLSGEPTKAADILDPMLEADPNVIPVLSLRAVLSLHGGNRAAAQVCVDRALMLSFQTGGEPSSELHQLAVQIEQATVEPSATPLPEWTRPPRSVFDPVRKDASVASPAATPAFASALRPAAAPTNAAAAPVAPVGAATPTPAVIAVAPVAASTSVKSVGVVVPAAELNDARIGVEVAGQWAVSATAGSQYGNTQYSAMQATGAPTATMAGNTPDAWCPASKNVGTDWLEVTFAKPVHATEVRVLQNDTPGAIAKVEAIEPNGTSHVWWEGVDPYQAPAIREIAWFAVRVPKTDYLVAKIKLTLDLSRQPGWKEIDAVQLVGGSAH